MAGASLVLSAAEPSPEPFFVPFFLISLGLRLSRIERDVDPVKPHMMRNNMNFLKETMIVFVYSKCPIRPLMLNKRKKKKGRGNDTDVNWHVLVPPTKKREKN